nr:hypothetical protein [uncultured Bacteroides sp.]
MKNVSFLLSFLYLVCACSTLDDVNCIDTITDNTPLTRSFEDVTWDWTKPESFTYAYIQGVGKRKISSPFNTESTPNRDLNLIIAQKDYLPQQGWVLLDKVLGSPISMVETPYPYFILYNRYKGIMRLFMLNTNQNEHNRAMITLEWGTGSKTALLTYSNKYPQPDDYYVNNETQEKVSNIVDDYYNSSWFVSDFLVAFDHTLDPTKNYNLSIKIYSQVESNLNMNGKFHFETTSASLLSNTNSSGSTNILADAGNFINKLPGSNEIEKGLKQLKLKIDSTNIEGKQNLYNKIAQLTNSLADGSFGQILKTVGGISSGLKGTVGVLTSIFKLFIGKSTSAGPTYVELMPTVSDGSATLEGTISTTTNATQCVLQLPGTNHIYSDGSININGLPIYDKPLGIFSLESLPTIRMKKAYAVGYHTIVHPTPHGSTESDIDVADVYESYLCDDFIRIALNKECGLEYVSGTAQIVSYDIPHVARRSSDSRVKKYLDSNIYEALDDKSYATRPVSLDKFKGTSFLAQGDKVYLKLNLVFKPTDANAEQTPVLISQMYLLSKIDNVGVNMPISEALNYAKTHSFEIFPATSEQDPASSIAGMDALVLTKY